jgi:hypothetical protein
MTTEYLTAEELGISELTRKYLIYAAETLPSLTTPQKLNGGTFGFDMRNILIGGYADNCTRDQNGHRCGTAGCILGLMQYKAGHDGIIPNFETRGSLYHLFYPSYMDMDLEDGTYDRITNEVAAQAVVRYLTTGTVKFERVK